MPVLRDWLMIRVNGFNIMPLILFNNFMERPSCPALDLGFKLFIIVEISCEDTIENENEWSECSVRYVEKCGWLAELILAANVGPTFVKKVLNRSAISALFVIFCIIYFEQKRKYIFIFI